MYLQLVKNPDVFAGAVAPMPKEDTTNILQIKSENSQPVSPFSPIPQQQIAPMTPVPMTPAPQLQTPQTPPATQPPVKQPTQPTQPTQTPKKPQFTQTIQNKPQQIEQPRETSSTPIMSLESQRVANATLKIMQDRQAEGKDMTPEERQRVVEQIAQRRGLQGSESGIIEFIDQQMQKSGMGSFDEIGPQAMQNQKNMQRLSQMGSDEMAQMIENGMIKAGQEIELQGMQNYQEALAKIKAKQESKNANNIINADTAKKEDNTKTIKTKDIIKDLNLSANLPDSAIEQVRSLKADETLNSLSGEIGGLDSEIFDIQNKIKNLKKTITTEFPTSLSKSAMDAIMYDRSIAMNDELEAKIGLRQAKVSDYERVKSEKQEQIKQQLMQQQQTMDFLGSNGGMALMGTSTAEILQMEQDGMLPKGYASLYENQMEAMTGQMLSSLGNMTSEDQNAVRGFLQAGMSPQQAISELQKTGRFNPETANAYGFMSLGDGQVAVTNKLTGQVKIMSKEQATQTAQSTGYNMQTQDTLNKFVSEKSSMLGKQGGQCGVFLNEYLKNAGMEDWRVGSTVEEKIGRRNRMPEEGPIDGAVVIMQGGTPESKQYGHVGVVFRDQNGQRMIMDSNYNGDEKVGIRPFDQNNKSILGYQDPNKTMNTQQQIMSSGQQSAQQITPQMIANYPVFEKFVEGGEIPAKRKLESMGISAEQFAEIAQKTYAIQKNKELNNKGFSIIDPQSFASMPASDRKKFSETVNYTQQVQASFQTLKDLVKTKGVQPTALTTAGKKISQETENIQLLAKEIYNLGVLNGPDLALMKNIIPFAVGAEAIRFGQTDILEMIESAEKRFTQNIADKGASYGLQYNGFGGSQKGSGIDTQTQTQAQKTQPITYGLSSKF